jgi:hypothetical protein
MFSNVLNLTHYNDALLKYQTLISTKIACFKSYLIAFSPDVFSSSSFWDLCIPHNAATCLLKYVNILQTLQNVKGVSIHYVKYLVRSMMGFLYYAKYKESNKT